MSEELSYDATLRVPSVAELWVLDPPSNLAHKF